MKILGVINFKDTGPLWRSALELNAGLPCINKVLLYFTLLYIKENTYTSE